MGEMSCVGTRKDRLNHVRESTFGLLNAASMLDYYNSAFNWSKFRENNIQSNLVISNSLFSNYRLSRSENLVPVLT